MRIRKWNWSAACFIVILGFLGALGNKDHSITDAFLIAIIFGVPLGILFAYMGKNE